MFSTQQLEVVKSVTNTAYTKGYKYYVAYTHTNTNSGYYYTVDPDLYIIVSMDKIEAESGYSYTCSENSLVYTCRTVNYSTSQYAVNTDRIVVDDYLAGSVVIPAYEHVYTNAEYGSYSIMPDILQEGGQRDVYLNSSSVILAAFLFIFCFFKMWQIHK